MKPRACYAHRVLRSTFGLLLLVAGSLAACGEKPPTTTAPVRDVHVPDRTGPSAAPAPAADEPRAHADETEPGEPSVAEAPPAPPPPPPFDPAPTLALMGWGVETR